VQRTLESVPRRALHRAGDGFDDQWCLLSIGVHLRDIENRLLESYELLTGRREPRLRAIDFDDIPLEADYRNADADDVAAEFHYLRRHSVYMLWELDRRDWQRAGTHPYLGRMTLLDLVRRAYEHDLEHLWQARRMLDRLASATR
jgi:hypothetical protein